MLLAGDHHATSDQIRALLTGQSDIRELSTGESVQEVLSLAARNAFDLGMVSAAFGGNHGLCLAYRLKHLPQALPVLIYANPVDARLAGAAIIAGADGVFDPKTGDTELANLLGRIATGAQAFPPLEPDPFHELADRVDEENRQIVGMLLLRLAPDEIANLLGISARSFRVRREAIVRRLDEGCAATTLIKEMSNLPIGSSIPAGRPESPSAARQDRRADPRGLLLSPRRRALELYRAAPIASAGRGASAASDGPG